MFFISKKREIPEGEDLINTLKNVNIFGSSYDWNEYNLIFENARNVLDVVKMQREIRSGQNNFFPPQMDVTKEWAQPEIHLHLESGHLLTEKPVNIVKLKASP